MIQIINILRIDFVLNDRYASIQNPRSYSEGYSGSSYASTIHTRKRAPSIVPVQFLKTSAKALFLVHAFLHPGQLAQIPVPHPMQLATPTPAVFRSSVITLDTPSPRTSPLAIIMSRISFPPPERFDPPLINKLDNTAYEPR